MLSLCVKEESVSLSILIVPFDSGRKDQNLGPWISFQLIMSIKGTNKDVNAVLVTPHN